MKIDGLGSVPIKPETTEALKNIEVGDVIKGRVVETSEGSVTIKTPTGHTITAALLGEASIQKGAFVELLINNIKGGKLLAEMLDKGQAPQDAEGKLVKMLGAMNIPVNDKTLEAAKLLIKYNMPVSGDDLSHVLHMQKNTASLSQSSKEALLGLLLSGKDLQNTSVDVLNKLALTTEGDVKNLLNTLLEAENKGAAQQAESTENRQPTANIKAEGRSEQANPLSAEKGTADILEKLGVKIEGDVKQLLDNAGKMLTSLSKSDLEALVFLLSKDMEVTPKNLELLSKNIDHEAKLSEFLNKLDNQLEVHDNKELRALKEDIKKIFLSPRQLEGGDEVKEQLKDMIKLGEKLERLLGQNQIQDGEIKSTLMNLRDNIDFLRNINQHNNYLQIPVLINGNQTTAELYVFKDGKRNKSINPENATILLALDLKYLGHLESMIHVVQKTVNLTFRLEDVKAGALIQTKHEELRSALEAKGYSLNPLKIIKLDEAFNLVSLEKAMGESQFEKLHFDMRV